MCSGPSYWCHPKDGRPAQGELISCQFRELTFFLFFLFLLFRATPPHMEVPRRGVELELQLLAYTTATAEPWDQSCVLDLPHSSNDFSHTLKTTLFLYINFNQ